MNNPSRRHAYTICMFLAALLVSRIASPGQSGPAPAAVASLTGFLNKTLTSANGERRYVVYVPPNYTPEEAWPLIVFLHGGGERGDDGLLQSEAGIGRAIRRWPERFPCLVLMPQCPKGSFWASEAIEGLSFYQPGRSLGLSRTAMVLGYREDTLQHMMSQIEPPLQGEQTNGKWQFKWADIADFLDDKDVQNDVEVALEITLGEYNIDLNRVSLTGLSMGGFATWIYGARHPERYAALMPVAGGGRIEDAHKLACIPIQAFHGALDPIVSPEQSRRMVAALRAEGCTVLYSEFPGLTHDCWDEVYGDPDAIEWLLNQSKERAFTAGEK